MTSASTYSKPETARPPSPEESGSEEDPVAARQVDLERLPRQQPPLGSSCWLHGSQPAAGQVNVIVSQSALSQIVAHSNGDVSKEQGGALLGRAYRQESRVFVEVAAAIPAVSGDHGPVHFTFTADTWAEMHQERAKQCPELDFVGWFHTHPDLGVFYSGDDVVVHTAAFTMPWHVGLVVDPVRNEACFFGWMDGELVPLNGFYEQHEENETSVVPWQMVQAAVWEESYDPHRQSRVYAPESGWPAMPSIAGPLGLVAGLLGVLLGFFLLVGWVIPLNRQVDRLASIVLTMVDDETLSESYATSCPDRRLRILSPVKGHQVSVGSRLVVLGTADWSGAYRYRVETRPSGGESWSLLNARRRDTDLGQLAVWDTAEVEPTLYEIRLTAVDRNNIILNDSPNCAVEVQLTQ